MLKFFSKNYKNLPHRCEKRQTLNTTIFIDNGPQDAYLCQISSFYLKYLLRKVDKFVFTNMAIEV